MTESGLHLFMKQVAVDALNEEGFLTFLEPEYPPVDHVRWANYRPDIFGVKRTDETDEYVFVECETRPASSLLTRKKISSITVQRELLREANQRLILAIPAGRLRALDMKLRSRWELWLISSRSGEITRVGRAPSADRGSDLKVDRSSSASDPKRKAEP